MVNKKNPFDLSPAGGIKFSTDELRRDAEVMRALRLRNAELHLLQFGHFPGEPAPEPVFGPVLEGVGMVPTPGAVSCNLSETYTVGKYGEWSARTQLDERFMTFAPQSPGYPVFVAYENGLTRECAWFVQESDAEKFAALKNEEVKSRA